MSHFISMEIINSRPLSYKWVYILFKVYTTLIRSYRHLIFDIWLLIYMHIINPYPVVCPNPSVTLSVPLYSFNLILDCCYLDKNQNLLVLQILDQFAHSGNASPQARHISVSTVYCIRTTNCRWYHLPNISAKLGWFLFNGFRCDVKVIFDRQTIKNNFRTF